MYHEFRLVVNFTKKNVRSLWNKFRLFCRLISNSNYYRAPALQNDGSIMQNIGNKFVPPSSFPPFTLLTSSVLLVRFVAFDLWYCTETSQARPLIAAASLRDSWGHLWRRVCLWISAVTNRKSEHWRSHTGESQYSNCRFFTRVSGPYGHLS